MIRTAAFGFLAAGLVVGASLGLTAQAEEKAASGAGEGVSLFDGKTLEGWEGKEGYWSVKDGAITGTTTAENPLSQNTFLIWRGGKVGDFELKLKFKIVGGNSGIQYRSEERDDFVVAGYQADIEDGTKHIGILYEERGRGILAQRGQKVVIAADGTKEVVGKTASDDEILGSIKEHDWNDYSVTVKGNHLVQKINGHVTVDVTDNQSDKAAKEGILALQLHQGPPMVVQFKDVVLKK